MFPDYVPKKKDTLSSVTTGFLPAGVLIPLVQEEGVELTPVVSRGTTVTEGQVIAENKITFGNSSAKIHSPVPGVVRGIKSCVYPDGKQGKAIEIKLSGSFAHIGKKSLPSSWETLPQTLLLSRIADYGIVNTFTAKSPVSLSQEIKALQNDEGPLFFVRLFDEEMDVQTDSVISVSEAERVLNGIKIAVKAVNPREIILCYKKGEKEFLEKYFDSDENAENRKRTIAGVPVTTMQVNIADYPSGNKSKLSTLYIRGKKLPATEREIMLSSLFIDASTLALLSDAIDNNIPVTRIPVHVSGDCLRSSGILKVCIGSSFRSIAKQCGVDKKHLGKIIVNGMINGYTVSSLDAPLTKYVKSIFFVSKRDFAVHSEAVCLRCGRCREACPEKLSPDVIFSNAVMGVRIPENYIKSAELCTQCGLCNFACPAQLPLSQGIKLIKDKRYE